MLTPLSTLLSRAADRAGLLTLDIPDDWMQGRSAFGGLQVALAVRAMRALVPDRVLRTVQTTFLAPAAGALGARAAIVRQGKNTVHVEVRLSDADSTVAVVLGVFGAARSSRVVVTPSRPEVDASSPSELRFLAGVTPNFIQHFSGRWLRGSPPFAGREDPRVVIELALRDDGPFDEAHVVAIADFIPPIALSYLDRPAPGSTLTWMLELFVDDPRTLSGAGYRIDAELVAARDGYTSQAVTIWGPRGELVALSHQSMLVFG